MKDLIEKYVGKEVHTNLGGVMVKVKVLDIKQVWGKLRYVITPVAGHGTIAVENIA